jgi:serine/threonine protein phosphatase PrpC
MLTQSLGGTSRRVRLEPHVSRARLMEGDVIILCSDGLTDMLSEEDIVDVLLRRTAHPARALAGAAVDAGGNDNVTVIVINSAPQPSWCPREKARREGSPARPEAHGGSRTGSSLAEMAGRL